MTYSSTTTEEVCHAFAAGARLDLVGDVPAALLVALLAGAPQRAEDRIPALRLTGAVVRGPLELPGATVRDAGQADPTRCRQR